MSNIKIGIVEDEGVTTELIVRSLTKLKYQIAEPASNYTEAVQMLQTERPDLVLLDINFNEEKDGIDLAGYIKENIGIPFIFLTANGDMATIQRARHSRPLAFLVKPFTQVDLYAAIETAINLDRSDYTNVKEKEPYLFFKVGTLTERFYIPDVLFFENDARNFKIHCTDGRVVSVRITATELLEKLSDDIFVQIQRSFIINIRHIKKLDGSSVYLGDHQLVFKRAFKDTLLEKINAVN